MSDIPRARDELESIAKYCDLKGMGAAAEHIRTVIREMLYRRPAPRKAPETSVPMTPELAGDIVCYAKTYPMAPLDVIAMNFGVNAGRVSEVLQRHRRLTGERT